MFFYLQAKIDPDEKDLESLSDVPVEDVIFVSYTFPTRSRIMSSLLRLTS